MNALVRQSDIIIYEPHENIRLFLDSVVFSALMLFARSPPSACVRVCVDVAARSARAWAEEERRRNGNLYYAVWQW